MTRDPLARVFRKDERLSQAELAIDAESFARADTNKNGTLDRSEIGRLTAALTPTLELEIQTPAGDGAYSIKVIRRPDAEFASLLDVEQAASGNCRLKLDDTMFELRAEPVPTGSEDLRRNYLANFKSLDSDNNAYVDAAEMSRFGGASATFFKQADVDNDGKLFEPEYIAHVDRELALSQSAVTFKVSGESRSLFRQLDTNSDGRLSLRELREANAQFAAWDADGDRTISLSEMSVRLQAVVSAGTPRVNGPFQFGGQFAANSPRRGPRGPAAPGSGEAPPGWFLKMDKNRDGDLSPREFLGARPLFDKLDANHDGLISVSEAKEADRNAPAKP